MLAFLHLTFLGALVVGTGQVRRYVKSWPLWVVSPLTCFDSEATSLFEASSGSVSVGVDIDLVPESPATSHDPCVPAPESTSGILSPTITKGISHMVDVGVGEETLFVPNQVDASVGDVVIFQFFKFGLTLTQSTLEHPCDPSGGFNAGFRTSKPWNQTNETVTFPVQNSDPAWFFCRQSTAAPHCNAGMLFGLNPAGKMGQFLATAGSSVVSTMDDCFPTSSAVSYFPTGGSVASHLPTGGSAALPTMPPGLTSVQLGVFYTGYAGTGGTGYILTSAANVVPTLPPFTVASPSASTATSNGITAPTTASSAVKDSVILELVLPFLFSTLWVII